MALSAPPAASAADPPVIAAPPGSETVSGWVRNGVGTSVDRALVLLTPLGSAGTVRTARTDAAGRYQFDDVSAGTYRITAIRDGYQASIGSVRTWMERRMDLVLVPSGEPRLAAPPKGWVLTAPPRDILRDVDAVAKLPPSGMPAGDPIGSLPPAEALARNSSAKA